MAGSIGSYGAYLHDTSEYTGTFAEKMTVDVRVLHLIWAAMLVDRELCGG